ncbi:MAG: cell division protein SepF [Candidatus Aenigmatarchaeota archaeon]
MVMQRIRDAGKSFMASDRSRSKSSGSIQEEYIEVDVGGSVGGGRPPAGAGKMGIVIEGIAEFSDTEKVLKFLREGNIVLLKVKSIREKDLGELKRVVERLKRTVVAQNGDIVGIEQDWILLVPEHVIVHR